jgi:hypothetical protein
VIGLLCQGERLFNLFVMTRKVVECMWGKCNAVYVGGSFVKCDAVYEDHVGMIIDIS